MTCETDENTKNQSNDELAKIIYDSILDMYQTEWQRTRDIESKATGIVGFVGIIFSLTISSLSLIISSADSTIKGKLFYSPIPLWLVLTIMILSIICGIKALYVKDWWFLEAEKILDHCTKNKLTKKEYYNKVSREVAIEGIIPNRTMNEKIAKYLKYSYVLFIVSIVFLVFDFLYILTISI